MRRSGGSRFGALVSLSVVVALGTPTVVSASAAGASPVARPVSASPAPDRESTSAVRPLRRVSRERAAAARRVDLPRPVRGESAVRLLGDLLDEAAALNDLSAAALVEMLSTDPTVWLDREGVVFFKDEPALAPALDPMNAQAPLDQTFLLHSKDGSPRTIYLDFDGGTASGTAWHANYPATPATQPAWDPSGNGAAFDDAELAKIQTVWQSVAEDYAPFDVDVTTADPGAARIFRSSATDQSFGSHVLITPSVGAHDAICGGCGGVAYLDVFDTVDGNGGGAAGDGYGYMQPAWVFPHKLGNSPKNIAEAASHEVGHNFGLDHDGNAVQGYDTGHGSWAPIMGTGYVHPISQWSKGDYTGATNTEDDIATIRAVTGARVDEAGTSISTAPAVPTGTAYVSSRTDVDTYLLGTCTGSVSLSATADTFANLDIELTLRDASGLALATADPGSAQASVSVATGMEASLTRSVVTGTYYVSVDGVGNGTPTTGYDDYGSVGAYTLATAGCDGAAPSGTPSAPTSGTASPHATDPSVTVSWDAPDSAGTSAVTGYLLTRSGSDTTVQVGSTVRSHAWTGLESGVAYSFTVTAVNAQGPGATTTMSATTASNVPSVPLSVTGSWDSLGQRALFGWSAPASSGGTPVSSYDIFVDGAHRYFVGGAGTYVIPLAPGTHTLAVAAVNSSGTGPFAQISIVIPDSSVPKVTTTTLTATSENDTVTLTAAVTSATGPAGSNGSLVFREGDAVVETVVVVADGEPVVVSVPTVLGGPHTYTASFAAQSGDFAPSSASATVVVAKTSTDLTLTTAKDRRRVTLSAVVSSPIGSPGGQVTFLDGGVVVGTADVSDGTAVLALDGVLSGDHDYTATFAPTQTERYQGSASVVRTLTMAPSATTTTLAANGGDNTVSLDVLVTSPDGTTSGAVAITEQGIMVTSGTVTDGRATFALTDVASGSHTYLASYAFTGAGEQFGPSVSQPVTVQVNDVPPSGATTTALAAQATRRTVTLRADVSSSRGTPFGSVQFAEDGLVVGSVALTSGVATLTRPAVPAGSRSYTATFVTGDAAAYSSSVSATVLLAVQKTVTTTMLTGAVDGSTVTLDIALAGTDNIVPSGPVRVMSGATELGTVQLAGGVGRLMLSSVAVGTRDYRAVFDGSSDLAGSVSELLELTVAAPPATTTPPPTATTPPVTPLPSVALAASSTKVVAPRTAKIGSRPTVTVSVARTSSVASGKVVITVGKVSKTLTLKSGKATLKLAKLTKKGKVKITVRYLGDVSTAPSTGTRTIKVKPA